MSLDDLVQERALLVPGTVVKDSQTSSSPEQSPKPTVIRPTSGRFKIGTSSTVAPKDSGNGRTLVSIGTKPTLIEKNFMRFLIMDAPRQSNLHLYIKEMARNNVTDVVRVCEPIYRGDELKHAGIRLHEMEFKDGCSPSKDLVMTWLELVENTFFPPITSSSSSVSSFPPEAPSKAPAIAVHCVAGLGRAPLMVAIALIEFANMEPLDAVNYIRSKRRGAINEKQCLYLESYKRQYKVKKGVVTTPCCVIS